MQPPVLSPVEFVALTNQILANAYPEVLVEGEVSEWRVRKGQWVYFKLKDDEAVVDFFGSVYQLQTPIEDGMLVQALGQPRLHPKFGFSVNFRSLTPTGEGAIKRSFELLRRKLEVEGLFGEERKRPLPSYPRTIGLISAKEAAGANDFLTILKQRWADVEVKFAHVAVQGQSAPKEIAGAIEYFNQIAKPVDVLVVVRGGGGLEDLSGFNAESVVRAIAGSRSPVLVGVGHEHDLTLADMVADVRAATPTQAAQLVVPDQSEFNRHLKIQQDRLNDRITNLVGGYVERLELRLGELMRQTMVAAEDRTKSLENLLLALDPRSALRRGYSLIRTNDGRVIRSKSAVNAGDTINAELSDGVIQAEVSNV